MSYVMKKKIQFDDFQFLPEGGRACYFYTNYLILRMYTRKNHPWSLGIGAVGNSKNHEVSWYLAVENEKVFDAYLQRFVNDSKRLQKLENYITKTSESTVKRLKGKDYSSLNQKTILSLLMLYYNSFESILLAAATIRLVDRALITKLRSLLNGSANVDERIRLISMNDRIGISLSEEIALLQLARDSISKKIPLNSKMIQKRLKNIADKYCWSTMGYYNERARTLSDYQKVLKKMIKGHPLRKLQEIRKRHRDDEKARADALKKLPASSRMYAKIAARCASIKDYFKFSVNEMTYFAEPLFEEIARRTKIKASFLKDLSPDEITSLFQGKKINRMLVRARNAHHIGVVFPTFFQILAGKEARNFENRYLKVQNHRQNEFRGRVACAGFARGKAKVILQRKDFSKMKKGDILVATNTSPDFIPLIRKAAAIVAEEGGLTAHVSVVSREFGVPAIVGIPHITKILKDGDLVEVDARKGVVRKLE